MDLPSIYHKQIGRIDGPTEHLSRRDEIQVEMLVPALELLQRIFSAILDKPNEPKVYTVTQVNRGSTFALRRSTLDFCLGGQRSKDLLRHPRQAK